MRRFSLLAVLPLEQLRSLLVWNRNVVARYVTMGFG
ncbi:MAG: hypothetical protein AW10_00282 [Candidatus Accumulibacter appositus]|uniref:Uncharacterized protein n=1 Tax=Candidatus Accumulibacter appositus TaxID=1454003 RepID=A0A011NJ74_9PROT|nr:MAG: hypothetical protein AW10_00282 [Candidatus Accumulibacter appositus]